MKNIFVYCGMALSLFCMDVSGVGVAEDKPTITKPVEDFSAMSHDDMTSLEFVLHHVRGSSPSSMLPFMADLDESIDE